jgi:exopolyphosphatase/guanosine-5'-triphosphate,3'-diphosphate pyrophosphatase
MARDQEAESVRVIATSAARDAKNADVLLEAVRRAAGLRVEILSGEREAEWVFAGVTTDPRLHGQRLLILDVGGGSTEFIVGEHDKFSFRESFDMGSVRLLELLRPHDPPSVSDVAATRDWLKKFFAFRIAPRMSAALGENPARDIRLVGTGGTTTILARMELKVERFDREKIEGTILSRETVLDYMFRLWSMSLAQRRTIPGLPGNRADVIIMGVAIYETVMEQFNFADLYVSLRGLRYGAILQQS